MRYEMSVPCYVVSEAIILFYQECWIHNKKQLVRLLAYSSLLSYKSAGEGVIMKMTFP